MTWHNPYYNPDLAHHRPHGFCNLEQDVIDPKLAAKWWLQRKLKRLPKAPKKGYQAFQEMWWQQADFSGEDNRVWWLGHASFAFRIDGRYFLTDPVFSKRASPSQLMGPKRRVPPPFELADLPRIDVIMVSHNHYDHLDGPWLRSVVKKFPEAKIVVPLGVKKWFVDCGFSHVTELDWWQSMNCFGVNVYVVPARHWSSRRHYDKNRSLWGGFVLEKNDWRFYFSGDTGFSDVLHTIKERIGPIALAGLPIGAYAPQWFMAPQHMSPDNAVKLFMQLDKPPTIAMHWAVFELADEPIDEPPIALQQALQQANLSDAERERFQLVKIGTSFAIDMDGC